MGACLLGESNSSAEELSLTHAEAIALMTAYRFGPMTTYRLRRMYAEALVASYSNSTGTVYPLVRRLAGRGLLEMRPIEGSKRGAETIVCTEAGRRALRAWVLDLGKEEGILADTARTKLTCFNLLTPEERIAWVERLQQVLVQAETALAEYYERNQGVPYVDLIHDNFTSTLSSRQAWADRTHKALVADAEPSAVQARAANR